MKTRGLFLLISAWTGLILCCIYYYTMLPTLPASVLVHNKRCADGSLDCYEQLDESVPAKSRSHHNEDAQAENEISPTVLGTYRQDVLQQDSEQNNQHAGHAQSSENSPGKLLQHDSVHHSDQRHVLKYRGVSFVSKDMSTTKSDDQFPKLQKFTNEDQHLNQQRALSPGEMPTTTPDDQPRSLQQGDSRSEKVSFALSLHFMDQITCAARRVRSLQCWAAQSKRVIQVVEPTINGSYLGPPMRKPVKGIEQFRNMFDINWWNTFGSIKAKYLPLVASDDFFRHAPRSTILVSFLYQDDPRCFENSPPNSTCTLNEVMKFWSGTLQNLSFKIINTVCIDFRKLPILSRNAFNRLIFGSVPVEEPVTIIFNDWRGPLSDQPHKHEFRAILRYRDSRCSPMMQDSFVRTLTAKSLKPTPEFFHSAEAYAMKYLHSASKYVAIMVRWELILLEHVYRYHAFKGAPNSGKNCKEKIRSILIELYAERGITTTFLATDAGKYGSKVLQPDALFQGKSYWEPAKELTEELLKALNNNSMTMEQYDRRFEEFSATSSFSSTYYVPLLQKAIAVRADCLLLVGWGTFHDNVLALYTELHGHGMDAKKICYKHIQSC